MAEKFIKWTKEQKQGPELHFCFASDMQCNVRLVVEFHFLHFGGNLLSKRIISPSFVTNHVEILGGKQACEVHYVSHTVTFKLAQEVLDLCFSQKRTHGFQAKWNYPEKGSE